MRWIEARKLEDLAMQPPESWMEDFPRASWFAALACLKIDPAFAETLSEIADYHAFLEEGKGCRQP